MFAGLSLGRGKWGASWGGVERTYDAYDCDSVERIRDRLSVCNENGIHKCMDEMNQLA